MTRRKILIAGTALVAAAVGSAVVLRAPHSAAEPGAVTDQDHVLGAADAPITIIEYSSLTCPHCATFHETTFVDIKKNWVETGRARFIHRHFPLDGLALRAAALANCQKGPAHYAMLDVLFRGQARWSRAEDPVDALAKIASLAGLDRAAFDACISDEAEIDRILQQRQDGEQQFDVRSTPTLIVNGKKVEGALTYEELEPVLEQAASQS